MLNKLYPARAAACKHRKRFKILYPFKELCCFFHYCKIGCDIHVEYTVYSKPSYCGYHLPLNICTNRAIKTLSESSSYRRCRKEYNFFIRICYSVPRLVYIALFIQCAYRACNYTLTTANTWCLSQTLLKRTVYMYLISPAYLAYSAYALYLVASGCTATAKYTFIIIADYIW